jgi:hypothetical protein
MMFLSLAPAIAAEVARPVGCGRRAPLAWVTARAQQQAPALSALDYSEIGQLANRYAHAIDTRATFASIALLRSRFSQKWMRI